MRYELPTPRSLLWLKYVGTSVDYANRGLDFVLRIRNPPITYCATVSVSHD